jgi:hypothetical protein
MDDKDKLDFISNEIQNLIALKNSSESNVNIITKYYSLVLTAFFAYVVFYSSPVSNNETRIVYAILGLCFVVFVVASTYYTTYTIIKNLKRRILFRREITNLRGIANSLMNNLYNNKIICQLDSRKITFTSFGNLPSIAIMIGTVAPLISFIFIKEITLVLFYEPIATQVAISVCEIGTVGILAFMLNLYTVHRKEYLIAERTSSSKTERTLITAIDRKNDMMRKKEEYQKLKKYEKILIGFFSMLIFYKIFFYGNLEKWNWDINLLELLFASFIFWILVKKNRFFNMRNNKKEIK